MQEDELSDELDEGLSHKDDEQRGDHIENGVKTKSEIPSDVKQNGRRVKDDNYAQGKSAKPKRKSASVTLVAPKYEEDPQKKDAEEDNISEYKKQGEPTQRTKGDRFGEG